jgi:hypothetical protein
VIFSSFKSDTGEYSTLRCEMARRQIAQLGGAVVDNRDAAAPGNVDPNADVAAVQQATHIICPPRSSTVKALGARVLGRWVMPISWLDASMRAGAFVAENEYGTRYPPFTEYKGKLFYLHETSLSAALTAERIQLARKLLQLAGAQIVDMPQPDLHFVVYGRQRDRAAGPVTLTSLNVSGAGPSTSIISWDGLMERMAPGWNASKPQKRSAEQEIDREPGAPPALPERGVSSASESSSDSDVQLIGQRSAAPTTPLPMPAPQSRDSPKKARVSNADGVDAKTDTNQANAQAAAVAATAGASADARSDANKENAQPPLAAPATQPSGTPQPRRKVIGKAHATKTDSDLRTVRTPQSGRRTSRQRK